MARVGPADARAPVPHHPSGSGALHQRDASRCRRGELAHPYALGMCEVIGEEPTHVGGGGHERASCWAKCPGHASRQELSALEGCVGWLEEGSGHVERLEEFGAHDLLPRRASDERDDVTGEREAAVAVGEGGSGIEQLARALQQFDVSAERALVVTSVDENIACVDAGGVGDEVAELDSLIEAVDIRRERIVEAEQPGLRGLRDQRRRQKLRDRARAEASIGGCVAARGDDDLAVDDAGDRDAWDQGRLCESLGRGRRVGGDLPDGVIHGVIVVVIWARSTCISRTISNGLRATPGCRFRRSVKQRCARRSTGSARCGMRAVARSRHASTRFSIAPDESRLAPVERSHRKTCSVQSSNMARTSEPAPSR